MRNRHANVLGDVLENGNRRKIAAIRPGLGGLRDGRRNADGLRPSGLRGDKARSQ